jgi:hypothetical protein
MEMQRVKVIIEEKYAELTGEIITALEEMEPVEIEEDDGSPYASAWEAFADEVQADESSLYDLYEEAIDEMCQDLLEDLSYTELKLLWLGSGGYVNWHSENPEDFPDEEVMAGDVLEELYSWVEQRAADFDLEEDAV